MKRMIPGAAALALGVMACSLITRADDAPRVSEREPVEREESEEERPRPTPSLTHRPLPTATDMPTPTPTLTPTPTPVQDISSNQEPDPYYQLSDTSPNINRGIGVAGLGGFPPCIGTPDGEVEAWVHDEEWRGGAVSFEPPIDNPYDVGYFETIDVYVCVGGRNYSASAIAPNGDAVAVGSFDYQGGGGADPFAQVFLPATAFEHPGRWHLVVEADSSVNISIDIPESRRPQVIADYGFLFDWPTVLGVGFDPHEPVVIIFIFADPRSGRDDEEDFDVAYGYIEQQADADGVVGPIDTSRVIGSMPAMVYFVGQSGNIAGYNHGDPYDFRPQDARGNQISPADLLDALYESYWRSLPPLDQCPGFQPSRLTEGEGGRVLSGPPNRLRDGPGMDYRIIDEIPGGDAFGIIKGPACAEGTAWWLVDYEGLQGWTAEGEGDAYWLEPLP